MRVTSTPEKLVVEPFIDQQYVDGDGNPVGPPASQVMEQRVPRTDSHRRWMPDPAPHAQPVAPAEHVEGCMCTGCIRYRAYMRNQQQRTHVLVSDILRCDCDPTPGEECAPHCASRPPAAPVEYDTVIGLDKQRKHEFCPLCGWPAVIICCNGPVALAFPTEDWVAYCSNVTCANHVGAVRSNQGGIEWR